MLINFNTIVLVLIDHYNKVLQCCYIISDDSWIKINIIALTMLLNTNVMYLVNPGARLAGSTKWLDNSTKPRSTLIRSLNSE